MIKKSTAGPSSDVPTPPASQNGGEDPKETQQRRQVSSKAYSQPRRRVVHRRPLRFKCPYCGVMLSGEIQATCPECGKKMRIPGPLRSTRAKRRPPVRKEQIERIRAEAMVNNLPPFLLRRNTPLLFVFILVFLFLGLGLFSELTDRYEDPAVIAEAVEVAEAELRVLRIALERFREDVGRYPTTEENLPILCHGSVRVPEMRYRYISNIRPDPWDQYYIYRNEDGRITLLSSGYDRTEGTGDDVYAPEDWEEGVPRNWPEHTIRRGGEQLVIDILQRLPSRTNQIDEWPDLDDLPELPGSF